MISFIQENTDDDDNIKKKGVHQSTELYNKWTSEMSTIFTFNLEIVLKQFIEWKFIIKHHLQSNDESLHIINNFKKNKDKRKYILSFRRSMINVNMQKKLNCYWMMYDYAKSMGVSQTLCENIGSTVNDTYTDKKHQQCHKK